MAQASEPDQVFNIAIVGQHGRLAYEALLFAASLRHNSPNFKGKLYVMEPQPGPLWSTDPRIKNPEIISALHQLGANIVPFETRHFGDAYPYGNKIEMLSALPAAEPFVFFDTDTLLTGDLASVPFNFERPMASMRRTNTWPVPQLYGPQYGGLWKSLYDKFDLDFDSSLDHSQPDDYWQRYLYFNAGFFFYRCPHEFGAKFLEYALAIRDDPPTELCAQSFDPWLYAREPDYVVDLLEKIAAPNKLKKVLKGSEPIKRMVYNGRGRKARALFDQTNLPRKEQAIRNRLKSNGYWLR